MEIDENTITGLPRTGHCLAAKLDVQARFIEVHEAHHEIRLFGNGGTNEFASHMVVNFIWAEKQFAEDMVCIRAGSAYDAMAHAKLLDKAFLKLNCLIRANEKS